MKRMYEFFKMPKREIHESHPLRIMRWDISARFRILAKNKDFKMWFIRTKY